jgi:hypothetical protein
LLDGVADLMRLSEKPWTEADIRASYCPEIKKLPFIGMKEGLNNACENAELYWCDEPTKHGHHDYKRGRTYALLTIEAIERDRPKTGQRRAYAGSHYLAQIFEAMITDAIDRRRKGGIGSRKALTSTMDGFLYELSRAFCGADPERPHVS